MPDQEAIENQLQLLAAYRQTLNQYLKQQAMIGMVYIQPGVVQGIRESRTSIRRVKGILRIWGVNVDDWPDDEELPGEASTQPIIAPVPSTSSLWLLYWPMLIAIVALALFIIVAIFALRQPIGTRLSVGVLLPTAPVPVYPTTDSSSPIGVSNLTLSPDKPTPTQTPTASMTSTPLPTETPTALPTATPVATPSSTPVPPTHNSEPFDMSGVWSGTFTNNVGAEFTYILTINQTGEQLSGISRSFRKIDPADEVVSSVRGHISRGVFFWEEFKVDTYPPGSACLISVTSWFDPSINPVSFTGQWTGTNNSPQACEGSGSITLQKQQ